MTGRLLQYLTQAHIFRCHGDRSEWCWCHDTCNWTRASLANSNVPEIKCFYTERCW